MLKFGAEGESKLHRKPPLEKTYDIEANIARHQLTTVFDSGYFSGEGEDGHQTSPRKKAKKLQIRVLEDYFEVQQERFERVITEMEKENDNCRKLADALITYHARN